MAIEELTMIEILNPIGEPTPQHKELAGRPDSLDGKIIAFLDNGKTGAEPFLKQVETLLFHRFDLAGVVWKRKRSAAAGADSLDLDELAARSHAAVNAMGD